MDHTRSDLDLAIHLARLGGIRAMSVGALGVQAKAHAADLVTEADIASQQAITRELACHRPLDAIIGEEQCGQAAPAAGQRAWLIDPVDGTWNFAHGLDHWCCAVALRDERGETVAAAIYQPVTNNIWAAQLGAGATFNGKPIHVRDGRPLGECGMGIYLNKRSARTAEVQRCQVEVGVVRSMGSGSMDHTMIAQGLLDVWIGRDPASKPWDVAPGELIVREAGGVSILVQGEEHEWSVIGTSEAAQQIAAVIAPSTLMVA